MKYFRFSVFVFFCSLVMCGCARNASTTPVPGAKAQEAIRSYLKAEYAAQGLKRIEAARKKGTDEAESKQLNADLQAIQNIEFDALELRGSAEDNIVRVRIKLDGKQPFDGKEIRYFRMRELPNREWEVKGEADETAFRKIVHVAG